MAHVRHAQMVKNHHRRTKVAVSRINVQKGGDYLKMESVWNAQVIPDLRKMGGRAFVTNALKWRCR